MVLETSILRNGLVRGVKHVGKACNKSTENLGEASENKGRVGKLVKPRILWMSHFDSSWLNLTGIPLSIFGLCENFSQTIFVALIKAFIQRVILFCFLSVWGFTDGLLRILC